jgi:carbon starvation protein
MIVTTTAAWQKIMSDDIRIGFFAAANDLSTRLANGLLPTEKALVAPQLIFNQHLDGYLTLFFVTVLWIVVLDMLRMSFRFLNGQSVLANTETQYVKTQLNAHL